MRGQRRPWMKKLLIGAVPCLVISFVVLPMVSPTRSQLIGQEASVWSRLLNQLRGSRTAEPTSSLVDRKSNGSDTTGSRSRDRKSSDTLVDVGGHQILISPATSSSNSVRFDTAKKTSSSSTNCKPGTT